MKFFLDHDVPSDIGRVLRLKGYETQFLGEALPKDADDLAVMRYATAQRMIIVTCNRRDFLELARIETYAGIIILIRRRTRMAECASILKLLERAGESGLSNNINFA